MLLFAAKLSVCLSNTSNLFFISEILLFWVLICTPEKAYIPLPIFGRIVESGLSTFISYTSGGGGLYTVWNWSGGCWMITWGRGAGLTKDGLMVLN